MLHLALATLLALAPLPLGGDDPFAGHLLKGDDVVLSGESLIQTKDGAV